MKYTHTITIDQNNVLFSKDEDFMRMVLHWFCEHVRYKLKVQGRIELNTIRYIFAVDLDPTINPVFDINDMTDFDIHFEKIDDVWIVTVETEYK